MRLLDIKTQASTIFLLAKKAFVPFVILLLVFMLGGCPSPYYDKAKHTFHKSEITYRIGKLPVSWKTFKIEQCDLSFYHTRSSSAILINSTCRDDYEDVALKTLTQHVFYGFTKRTKTLQKEMIISRRAALYTEMDAKLDGVTVKAALFILKKNACIYDFVYAARPKHFTKEGIETLKNVIRGFKVLKE